VSEGSGPRDEVPSEEAPLDDDPDGAGPPPVGRVFDVGLQHERTALAWDRTGLSLLVVGVLTLRSGGPPFDDVLHAPGYLAMTVGAGLLWAGGRRYRRRELALRHGASPVHPRLVFLTGIAALAVSVAALLLILIG
jgi:uncharacterized membrane protein YidH (DUF202 family)